MSEYNVCNAECYRARYSLDTVHKHILFIFMSVLNELNCPIKETLDILILRVFQEKGQVVDSFISMPVLAIITCTVDDFCYIMSPKGLVVFSHFLS